MLTEDQILAVAHDAIFANHKDESSLKLADALQLVYDSAVRDAVEKIKTELRENEALLVDKEVIVQDSPKLIGREPWYMRKNSLEKKHRKSETIIDEEKEAKFKQDVRDSALGDSY